MNFKQYYEGNQTYHTENNQRLDKITSIVQKMNPKKILDVGCGEGLLIEKMASKVDAEYYGLDAYEKIDAINWQYTSTDITERLPFESEQFDCVVLGEVIEHVPNTDFVIREIRRVLQDEGYLIISTPNLASWANRILLPLGLQPLFTETSSEINLGRNFRMLGQGAKVQGHLKIFTSRSLGEILEKGSFVVTKKYGVPFFFPFPISLLDQLLANIVPLSSGLLYVAQKR
jgi:2-polyprenyl-3-methyl-5-hydroxy-6-metoxy-1,4-benzoquinol methylase